MKSDKSISCVVIDDEAHSRDLLTSHIHKFLPSLNLLGVAGNVADGVKLVDGLRPDLIFLDISMPDGDGFDLLNRCLYKEMSIVFVTAYNEYALKAFEFAALDYLLKPVSVEGLEKAILRHQTGRDPLLREKLLLMKDNTSGFKKIAVPVSSGYDFVEVSTIIRCEASGSYTLFFTTDGDELLVSKNLSSFEKLLPTDQFVRIHTKHLINLTHLKKYVKGKSGYVLMADQSHVDVSLRKKDILLERLKGNFGFFK